MHHGACEHPHGAHQVSIATGSVGCRRIRHSLWFGVELSFQVSTTQRHLQLPVTGREIGVEYEGYLRAMHAATVE